MSGSLLLLAGCPGPATTDAGTDVVTPTDHAVPADGADGGAADVPTTADGSDAAPPADVIVTGDGGDGGLATIAPDHYFFWYNTVNLYQHDAHLVAMGDFDEDTDIVLKPGDPPTSLVRVGANCIYTPEVLAGTARNSANALNLGTTTMTNGTHGITYTYDSTMHQYSNDTTNAVSFTGGVDTVLTIPGGPDGMGGTATLPFPPRLTTDNFPVLPMMLSPTDSSMNRIVMTLPTGATLLPDDVLEFVGLSTGSFGEVIVCTVPASALSITIPAEAVNHVVAAQRTSYIYWVGIVRKTTLPAVGTRGPIDFRVMSDVLLSAPII